MASTRKDGLRDYNEVADRVAQFNEDYPTGRITTQIVEQSVDVEDVVEASRSSGSYRQPIARGYVTVRAAVYKTPESVGPDGTGHSTMLIPGITQYTRDSELENAETSAVGRALAFIGYYAKGEGLASKQEIAAKGGSSRKDSSPKKAKEEEPRGLTDAQKKKLFASLREYAPDIADDSAKRKAFVWQVTAAVNGKGRMSTADMTGEDMDVVLSALKNIESEPAATWYKDAQDVESVKAES